MQVLLHTTFGDLDIELWCREAPLACRNFIQLCMEGYYDNVIFHRLEKGTQLSGIQLARHARRVCAAGRRPDRHRHWCATWHVRAHVTVPQAVSPCTTRCSRCRGDAAPGARDPLQTEVHQRLKFNRRGLVGMAHSGSGDNGSQFFITLDKTEELNKVHTLFGKITGNTIFNLLQVNDVCWPRAPPSIVTRA